MAEVLFGEMILRDICRRPSNASAEDNPTYANYYPEGDSVKVNYKEGMFVGYRGYEQNETKPLFPFGYGLSYTTFKFSNLKVTPGAAGSANFTVSFDVTNTGERAGSTVAQVYVADDHAAVPEPPKQLKGFERTTLKPGETQHVTVALDPRAFAWYDVGAKHWRITPGEFGVLVGQSSEQIDLTGSATVSATAAKAVND